MTRIILLSPEEYAEEVVKLGDNAHNIPVEFVELEIKPGFSLEGCMLDSSTVAVMNIAVQNLLNLMLEEEEKNE